MKIRRIKDNNSNTPRFNINIENTGFFYDTIPGISHLIEHLLCNSSKGLVFTDLKDTIASNAYTTDGVTTYTASTSEVLEPMNKLFNFKDLITHIFSHEFTEEELAREKEIIKNELSGHTTRGEYFYTTYIDAFYKDIKIYTSKEQIEFLDKITLEDVVNFYRNRYTIENLSINLVGNWTQKDEEYVRDFVNTLDKIPLYGENDLRLCAPNSYIAGDIRRKRDEDSPYKDYEYIMIFDLEDEISIRNTAKLSLFRFLANESVNGLFNDIRDLGGYGVDINFDTLHLGKRHSSPVRLFIGIKHDDKRVADEMKKKCIEYMEKFDTTIDEKEFNELRRKIYLALYHDDRSKFSYMELESNIEELTDHEEIVNTMKSIKYKEMIEFVKNFKFMTTISFISDFLVNEK